MLSKFDDYPIHQIPAPIAHVATGDRNAYDRYWFNGYQDDGEFYFGIGSAIYPNLGIMDCGFSIVRGGEQHAFHCSRRAPREPTDVEIGPFRIEILEPMRRLRFSLAPNETGIGADLLFTARTAGIEEGRQTAYRGGPRLTMDVTRFAQFGRWEGEITYAGETVTVEPARVYGTKDRSWGVRPVGPARPRPGPAAARRGPGLLPLGAAALARPVHALRRLRGPLREHVAPRRGDPARSTTGPRTSPAATTPPPRRWPASATTSTTSPAPGGPGPPASRSSGGRASARRSTSSR